MMKNNKIILIRLCVYIDSIFLQHMQQQALYSLIIKKYNTSYNLCIFKLRNTISFIFLKGHTSIIRCSYKSIIKLSNLFNSIQCVIDINQNILNNTKSALQQLLKFFLIKLSGTS